MACLEAKDYRSSSETDGYSQTCRGVRLLVLMFVGTLVSSQLTPVVLVGMCP